MRQEALPGKQFRQNRKLPPPPPPPVHPARRRRRVQRETPRCFAAGVDLWTTSFRFGWRGRVLCLAEDPPCVPIPTIFPTNIDDLRSGKILTNGATRRPDLEKNLFRTPAPATFFLSSENIPFLATDRNADEFWTAKLFNPFLSLSSSYTILLCRNLFLSSDFTE